MATTASTNLDEAPADDPQRGEAPSSSREYPARSAVAASVIIPTLGRPSLRRCLISVCACRPGPSEIVVVDQSRGPQVADLLAELADPRVRHVVSDGRGIALATNAGLRAATNDLVLVTHDDCTVAEDWVGSAVDAMAEAPSGMVSGRVLPVGDPTAVPSIRTETEPEEWTGRLSKGALWPANMAVSRDAILSMGAFDERSTLRWAAEDNDLCYRWISQGRRFRYAPQMVVWHHDWRSPEELWATYISYAKGQGAFYAKHLYAGDRRVLRFVVSDLVLGLRSYIAAPVRHRPRWKDPRRALPIWLPVGLLQGWRECRRLGPSHRS